MPFEVLCFVFNRVHDSAAEVHLSHLGGWWVGELIEFTDRLQDKILGLEGLWVEGSLWFGVQVLGDPLI